MEALALDDDSLIGKRSEPRTPVAVMASMAAASLTGSAMICNLSTRGALIESDRLPAVGERVELRRGDLFAAGAIVWQQGGKAGVRFEQRIVVSDWQPTSHAGQQTVDKVFRQLKAGIGKSPLLEVKSASALSVPADELERTANALEALADSLAEDIEVIERHATQIQVLDLATQIMRRLAAAG